MRSEEGSGDLCDVVMVSGSAFGDVGRGSSAFCDAVRVCGAFCDVVTTSGSAFCDVERRSSAFCDEGRVSCASCDVGKVCDVFGDVVMVRDGDVYQVICSVICEEGRCDM